jgi:Uma2 family endonuclease
VNHRRPFIRGRALLELAAGGQTFDWNPIDQLAARRVERRFHPLVNGVALAIPRASEDNADMSATLYSPPASLAPWAEVVPGVGPVTVDYLLTLPDDGYKYEVVEGTLVRMAGSGAEESTIAVELTVALHNYVRPRRLGLVTGADGVYKFPSAETGLVPDVAYFRAERRAQIANWRRPVPFAPDIAVEVASPDQRPDQLAAKARLYLSNGTRLVWVVWPASQHVDVWRADHPSGPVATHNTGERLDCEDVVPGFAYLVAAVFADPLDE